MNIQLPEISCTGCGACMQTCKHGAITMEPHEDGFLYPHINMEQCIRCGQCMKSCHALDSINMLNKPLSCYAAQTRNEDVLYHSTSGGLFYALATCIFEKKGIVYGCIFDEHYNAIIKRAESVEQLAPMHGSKYVWSSSSESYSEVLQDLKAGRTVMYSCLPCQAAGLRKYLRKPYDNLYIVDVLCGGAPSPFAFQEYLRTLTDEAGKRNLRFQFRDKDRYGTGVNCTYFVNGKKHHETWLENSFYFAFSSKSRITWRRSCYGCNYKSIARVSDITIGDYWGVEKYHKAFNSKDGVSVVLINSDKGSELLDQIKSRIIMEESNIFHVIERNSLVKEIEEGHIHEPEHRSKFFQMLSSKGWKAVDRKYLNRRQKIMIKQILINISGRIQHKFIHKLNRG